MISAPIIRFHLSKSMNYEPLHKEEEGNEKKNLDCHCLFMGGLILGMRLCVIGSIYRDGGNDSVYGTP
ncbi:hypothetical protein LAC02_18020 [Ligilactobacillus acidipiscis]|nr:hypothetical protein LAC02_18020 [Ligilactobacillus acidipiscis]